MMKKTSLALLALFAAGAAMATTYTAPPPPAPTPAPSTQSQTQTGTVSANPVSTSTSNGGDSNSASTSNASGGDSSATGGNATGGNVGPINASGSGVGGNSQGGAGGSSNVDASSYSATGPLSNTMNGGNSKYISLGFPAPVWTSVPTPFGCLVSESKALSVGWNFASGSKSQQFSDVVCTTIRMAEAATGMCHFAHAAMLNRTAFEQMYPGQSGEFFTADKPRNLSPMECEDLKRPTLRAAAYIAPPQQYTNVVVASPVSDATSCQVARPTTAKRATKPLKKAPAVCK